MTNVGDHPSSRRKVIRSDDSDNEKENEKDRSDDVVLFEDLLMKVFSRLPEKSLLRFKCLSKRWNHIISSDHYFIDLYSKSNPFLLAFSSIIYPEVKEENSEITLNCDEWSLCLQSSIDMEGNYSSNSKFNIDRRTMGDPSYPTMLPTRLDLVCCQCDDKIYVCNPTTHESITLPAFGPRSDFVDNLGFGYVRSTNEYKLVDLSAAFYDSDMEEYDDSILNLPTKCRVFTLAMQADSPSSYASPWDWKKIQNSPYNVELGHCPALVDGVVHWLINRKRHPEFLIDVNPSILAFSLETEEFRILPRPSECRDLTNTTAENVQLVELRGLLCFSCVQNDETKMGIWMLRRDYDHHHHNFMWAKEYTIDLTTLTLLDPICRFFRSDQPQYVPHRYRFYCVPRYILEEENKILLEGVGGRIPIRSFYYDIQTAGFTKFVSKDGCRSFFSFYRESLRSLSYVLQQKSSLIKLDQVIGVTPSQSLQLANMDPPIFIIRIFTVFRLRYWGYGGYLTNLKGGFVAIEGKQIVAGDAIETQVKAILRGLQFAREQGVQCIALVTAGSKKIVDVINNNLPDQEKKTFQWLERFFDKITQLLSEFIWAQVFHDHGLSTQVSAQIAFSAPWNNDFCLNEPPKWFVDG